MNVHGRVALAISIAAAAGCATTGPDLDPAAKVVIAEMKPAEGSPIGAETTFRLAVDYSVGEFKMGRDRLSVVFKIQGGGTWEPARHVLTKPKGRVTFEIAGGALVDNPRLVRPVQILVALDRWDASSRKTPVTGSKIVVLKVAQSQAELEKRATALSASVGKGQLISDMQSDPRYRPRLPVVLNKPGMVVWGLFKVCVDDEGDVYSATVVKSASSAVDDDWLAILRTLKHLPYTIDGQPMPYCYPMRLEVRSQE